MFTGGLAIEHDFIVGIHARGDDVVDKLINGGKFPGVVVAV